ncbi:uncharacterized protein LOC124281408 [Haliotis rubra]|uniref:uncharacterized protein LOC124281408 n=1 Tax=Haliotis rubra TaxID=36100 RepID=UPI001EE576E7|nr:uncharacterized protein LOC124281408 [Haliotis rubra]XP_046573402.1 uncharacterized protein LOC124281408 [Haliotis rubra]XP_046573403.1 uncharacterized protein LOC124281408 [Haliotis rubra]XP_046573404.1 uncharacterized protein LOC124281408 [Haliotis rubra]XP_046573405.1 uncharacterized protein LOC124281408 [Haliotis rubra]XP_046573407.1 uncharacterized protein LOC124281408 [Haliotis rubra]XP_046573408.1 uncharacterized protein LOC124281408 [Haliotis rubra]
MTDQPSTINTRNPKIVYSPRSISTHPTYKNPKRPVTMFVNTFMKHLKQEYWAYIALFGIMSLYSGVMVAVFGFTDIVHASGGEIEWFGIFLILGGIALIITSGILYHRKSRRLRPCICCGMDMDDTPEFPPRNKKRLRFAPNLISPYYEKVKHEERRQTLPAVKAPIVRFQRSSSDIETADIVSAEEQKGDNSEGSSTTLITDLRRPQVTKC